MTNCSPRVESLLVTDPAPIFVAGTGRSGTTNLVRVLGEHPLVHAIPIETRFIVDPGGLRDLADALSHRYDPYVGDDALRRLGQLLTVTLVGRSDTVFRGWDLPAAVGHDHYWDAVGRLWNDIVAYEFEEWVPAAGLGHASWPYGPHEPRAYRRALPRYFSDRSELIAVLRRMVESMFSGAASDAGKATWCEKTPFNLLAMPFLWELFPNAVIVHVKRHPLRVCASHLDQLWAPRDVQGVLAWLKPVYQRWLTWKTTFDFSAYRYVEIGAEDLATDWPARRAQLFEAIGLDDIETRASFGAPQLDHRDNQLSADAESRLRAELGDIVRAMGYD